MNESEYADMVRPVLPLNENEAYACRTLPDGRHLCVLPLTFGRARLVIGRDEKHRTYDNGY